MANTIIKGRNLMLFGGVGDANKAWSYATNHTLTITAETTDISSKDHGAWGASEVSKYTWEITSENLYTSEGYDALFAAMIAGDEITVRFGLKTESDSIIPADMTTLTYYTSTNVYYEGKVIITSLTANANNGENATYSVTLTGTGQIKKTATSDTPILTGTLNASGSTITYNGTTYYYNSTESKYVASSASATPASSAAATVTVNSASVALYSAA